MLIENKVRPALTSKIKYVNLLAAEITAAAATTISTKTTTIVTMTTTILTMAAISTEMTTTKNDNKNNK